MHPMDQDPRRQSCKQAAAITRRLRHLVAGVVGKQAVLLLRLLPLDWSE